VHASTPSQLYRNSRARALVASISLLSALACSDATAPAPPTLVVAAGGNQRALAGTELPRLIDVMLSDGKHQPLLNSTVTWAVQGASSDRILPLTLVTDSTGHATARWRLDSTSGPHTIVVTADDGATAKVSAVATPRPSSNVQSLPMVTYDGSGEMVHPDFARVPAEWIGDPFRLVATPYPAGNGSLENPSLFTGSTGASWLVPLGIQNPLEQPTNGYLSDPDVVYDPDEGELRIYYRHVQTENEIWMIRSADGVVWSAPVLVLHAANHMIVSPSVVRRGAHAWRMWSVNAGPDGCTGQSATVEMRHSADGITWSDPRQTSMGDPDGFPWHVEVEWIPSRGEYWAVYPMKQAGSCSTDMLRFATSTDGMQWKSYPSPILIKGASDDLVDIIYRSSIDFDEASGIISIWYSGATFVGPKFAWHLAWEQLTVASLFARVNAPMVEEARLSDGAAVKIPQLTNETAP
jgi:hypothetical protein